MGVTQAERANAEVLRGLRTKTFDRLRKSGRRWIDELWVVLWSIKMTLNRATGQTPFALVYGAEAVLPMELIYGSPRVLAYDELEQEQLRQDVVTLLEEVIFRLRCELLATSKPCAATISTRFLPEALSKDALFFGEFNPPRIPTS